MKPNFTSIPSRSRPRLFLGCLARPSAGDLALETRDLELFGFHLAVARKGLVQILDELLHPIAQLRRMHTKVLRRLGIGHAPFLDQSHSLKLELARKLSSLHDPPPAPSIGVFGTGCRPSCPQ